MTRLESFARVEERGLERESSIAYSAVASEYYDGRHMTCRAFDFLDELLLDMYQNEYGLVEAGRQYLEVGAGRAILLRSILPADSSLIMSDLCDGMGKRALPLLHNMRYRRFSAFNIPFPDNHFDGVFAFLADSYNVLGFYKEAWRVLKQGGFFLVTCPTRLWAATLRRGDNETLNYARFPSGTGKTVLLPSVTWTRDEYDRLLAQAGFDRILYEEFCVPPEYPSERLPDTIRVPAELLGVEVSRLPLVAAILSKK